MSLTSHINSPRSLIWKAINRTSVENFAKSLERFPVLIKRTSPVSEVAGVGMALRYALVHLFGGWKALKDNPISRMASVPFDIIYAREKDPYSAFLRMSTEDKVVRGGSRSSFSEDSRKDLETLYEAAHNYFQHPLSWYAQCSHCGVYQPVLLNAAWLCVQCGAPIDNKKVFNIPGISSNIVMPQLNFNGICDYAGLVGGADYPFSINETIFSNRTVTRIAFEPIAMAIGWYILSKKKSGVNLYFSRQVMQIGLTESQMIEFGLLDKNWESIRDGWLDDYVEEEENDQWPPMF